MKQKLLALMIVLVLFGSLVWANMASAWTATILAVGEELGGENNSNVKIGVEPAAVAFLAAPFPPPQYSVKMDLYTSDLAKLLSVDIRKEGDTRYTWIIGVDPHGNVLPPDPNGRTATISWNPLE